VPADTTALLDIKGEWQPGLALNFKMWGPTGCVYAGMGQIYRCPPGGFRGFNWWAAIVRFTDLSNSSTQVVQYTGSPMSVLPNTRVEVWMNDDDYGDNFNSSSNAMTAHIYRK
jgi:hypothetical protein